MQEQPHETADERPIDAYVLQVLADFTFDGGFQTAQPSDDYSASADFDCTFSILTDIVTCTGDLDGGEGVLIILKVRVTDPPTDNSISLQVTADSGTSETEANELNNEATGSVSVVDTP